MYFKVAAYSTGCIVKKKDPKPCEKSGSQRTALQQQRALARWDSEGGASPTGSQISATHADDRVSASVTTNSTEITAPYSRDERR